MAARLKTKIGVHIDAHGWSGWCTASKLESLFIVRDAAPPCVDVKGHVLELDHALSVLRCPLVNELTETVETYFVYAVNGHADSDVGARMTKLMNSGEMFHMCAVRGFGTAEYCLLYTSPSPRDRG